jgi:tRNA (mo5U34)-methyltransferase
MGELMASASVGLSLRNRVWRAFYRKVVRRVLGPGSLQDQDTLETDVVGRPDNPNAPLDERVRNISWYHTIDLGGIVTSGLFDHREAAEGYQLPARLDALRVLDVATFDGFWAFEFERRGATDVVALDVPSVADIDLPPRTRARMSRELLASAVSAGFQLAHEALGSRVQRAALSVYDLSPHRLGEFDLVFCGDLLMHLTNPFAALRRIRSVTRGRAFIVDYVRPDLDRFDGCRPMHYHGGRDQCAWWLFSVAALEAMIRDAGFSRVETAGTFRTGYRDKSPRAARAAFWAYP